MKDDIISGFISNSLCVTSTEYLGEENVVEDLSLKQIDEPQYCNKNVATPKATDFKYQNEVCTNLRGIETICATYIVSFLYYHDVMECMY